jgi:hypothetical protein
VTPPRTRAALTQHRAEVELSHTLVAIRTDLDLSLAPEQLAIGTPRRDELAALYRRLGFASLAAELAQPAAATAASEGAREIPLVEARSALAVQGPVAVAWSGDELAIASTAGPVVARGTPQELAGAVAPHLETLWCHDAKALLARLHEAGVAPVGVPNDTLLAGYLLAPGEPVDLATLSTRHGLAAPSPGVAGEATAAAALAPLLAERLARRARARYAELERPLVPVLGRWSGAASASISTPSPISAGDSARRSSSSSARSTPRPAGRSTSTRRRSSPRCCSCGAACRWCAAPPRPRRRRPTPTCSPNWRPRGSACPP